jgi:uncharacterized protein (DUF697 family)
MNKKKMPRAIVPNASAHPADADNSDRKPEAAMAAEMSGSVELGKDASPDVTEMSADARHAFAAKLVQRFALWSAAAGLIPLPIIDAAAVSGIQIQMVRRISQIYGVPFSDSQGKAIVASFMGSMIPASSGLGAASLLKGVPIVGMTVGALAMPVLSAGATYAIGMAFIQHFATGGTLLDFNPRDYREFIKAQKEMWSSRS